MESPTGETESATPDTAATGRFGLPIPSLRDAVGIGAVASLVLFGASSSSILQTGILRRENGVQSQFIGLDTTVSVFYNAHLVGVNYGRDPATTNVFLDSRFLLRDALLPAPAWLAFPVVVLCLSGAVAVRQTGTGTTSRAAFATGSYVAAGYLPLVSLCTTVVQVDWVVAVLVGGIVYPVVWGGTGGYLQYRLERDTAPEPTPSRVRVEMTDDLVFSPDAIEVSPGDTVTWENVGSLTHTVTAYEESLPEAGTYFASGGFGAEGLAREAYPEGGIGPGDTYSRTFETPGAYEYFCVPQEDIGMTGAIEVRAVDDCEPASDR